jgi:uncharacterized membrane protein
MERYAWLKLVHILSSTLLFGTGLGTAFYMWRAHRSGDSAFMAKVARNVVLADWVFTLPAVIVQPVTGLAMVHVAGFPVTSTWIAASLALYVVVGACWLPVVGIQIRVARLTTQAASAGEPIPPEVHRLMAWWYALGWPAFAGVIAIFALMVFKPA